MCKVNGGTVFPSEDPLNPRPGMSLRDWFAGQALGNTHFYIGHQAPAWIAHTAYEIADLMLAERDKEADDE